MKSKGIERMPVLMIGPVAPPAGGMATSMNNLMTSALKDKYDFCVLDTTGYLERYGRPNIFMIAYYQFSALFRLAFILIKRRPRIVHVHMATGFYFYRRAADIAISKLFGKKVIIHVRGYRFPDFCAKSSVAGKWAIRSTLGMSDKIIILSDHWKGLLGPLAGAGKLIAVPNGVKLAEFRRQKDKKEELGILKDKKTILFMGPIGRRKGAFDLLDAVPAVAGKTGDVVFIFCGSGERRGEIEKFKRLAEAKNLSSYIKYAGDVSGQDKYDHYLSSDIFVLPSYGENLPNSVLEAMAAGLPVVASDAGVIPELIQDGVNGFIIKAGDTEAIADRVIRLAQDSDLRMSMGKRNVELVKERYDMPIIAAKIDRIYRECLGSAG